MNIVTKSSFVLGHRHLLGIEGLSRAEIIGLLDLAEEFVALNRQIEKKTTAQRGRTLIDTAITLNAMHPDIIVVRHHASGAVELLAQKVDCSVINAGNGSHEHPTQALLDALTIRRRKGRLDGLTAATCIPITASCLISH
jgi:aspartate carbamoyltransferase catalytic subunit